MRRQSLALNAPVQGSALDRFVPRAEITRYIVISRMAGVERVVGVEHTLALAERLAERLNATAKIGDEFAQHAHVERVTIGPVSKRVDPARNLHVSWSAR